MSSENVVNKLQELAEALQTQRTLGGVLAGIAEAATASVPGCDAASIGISLEGRPATAATRSRIALELDLVQYDTDDGPCLTTFRTMNTVRLDLTDKNEPFPHFSAAAKRQAVRGVLSVPATWGDDLVATLNLYSRSGPFDDTGVSLAQVLAARSPSQSAAHLSSPPPVPSSKKRSATPTTTPRSTWPAAC